MRGGETFFARVAGRGVQAPQREGFIAILFRGARGRAMHRFWFSPVTWLLLGVCPLAAARAETVVLVGGGRIEGEVIERRSTAETLVLRTVAGTTVGIPREQVERVVPASETEQQYRAVHAQPPETLQGHLRLAQWCKEHGLPQYRTAHLRAVLRYEPDHAEARRLLGYSRRGGRWMTEEQWMASRGYVRYGRQWKPPQEVEILQQHAADNDLAGQWHKRIRQWYDWAIGRDARRRAEGLQALQQVEDPAAMEAMEDLLGTRADVDTRLLYLQYLVRVGNADAVNRLVLHSMDDLSMEVRSAALVSLLARFPKQARQRYLHALTYFEVGVVRTAAAYLGAMEDPTLVGPLIDALVTTHPEVPPLERKQVPPDGLVQRLRTGYVPPRMPEAIHPAVRDLLFADKKQEWPVLPRGWLRQLRREEGNVFALSPRDISDAIAGTGPKAPTLPAVIAQATGQTSKKVPNLEARNALIALTGHDFGCDKAAWLGWFQKALDSGYQPLLEGP